MRPFDRESITTSSLGLTNNRVEDNLKQVLSNQQQTQSTLRQFIRNFQTDEFQYPYRDQLLTNYNKGDYFLNVSWNDLNSFSSSIGQGIRDRPMFVLPLFELAAQDCVIMSKHPKPERSDIAKIQIQINDLQINNIRIRELNSDHISKLVRIPGIVISSTKSSPKATKLRLMCTNCQTVITAESQYGGFSSIIIPRQCPNQNNEQNTKPCPLDPFSVLATKSSFIDIQRLKLQELPEDISTGEMPKQIWLYCSKNLVNKVTPGSRVIITGVFKLFENNKRNKDSKDVSVRKPYVEVLGIEELNYQEKHGQFTEEETEELLTLSKSPNIYERVWKSIAPAIFESQDIKKAIACLLFSGSRKHLSNGMKLRGDINILLLGDPSVAKSQFLKFVHEVAPICVYTSGKGSSASGLTASVLREAGTGEFHLEGGAMVLADGGVVCIDEFDKMRENDRVAIHEAMEQQTISIAKAGITTMLNSRTSVLAAANPIFGRYDDLRSTQDNIDFETTILSRFDLIFIIRDIKNRSKDERLARHIMNLHIKRGVQDSRFTSNLNTNLNDMTDDRMSEDDSDDEKSSTELIKPNILSKYIKYCRLHCHPRLSYEAKLKLKSHYVTFRQNYKLKEVETQEQNAIPLTVRQLESLIRISESLAKMKLKNTVSISDVDEAVRLFKVSTLKSANQSDFVNNGINGGNIQINPLNNNTRYIKQLQRVESNIKRRLVIGSQMSTYKLINEMTRRNFTQQDVYKALDIMHSRNEIQYKANRKQVKRLK